MFRYGLGDLSVHRIGYGTKRLGASREQGTRLLRRAVELGVDHIDTAAWYPTRANDTYDSTGLEWANETIRAALWPYPSNLLIATKVGPMGCAADRVARPEELRGLVEENLRGLGRDHLDLVYLRLYGVDSIAAHFAVLAEMRDAGMIRHLGLSNVRPSHLAEALAIAPVVAVQNRYGIDFGRVNDDLLDECGRRGIAFVPFFAVAGERREVGGVRGNEAVAAFARAHGVSEAQVRIAWTLSRGPHVLAIPGTSDVAHLAENVRAAALVSSPGLAELGKLEPAGCEGGSDGAG